MSKWLLFLLSLSLLPRFSLFGNSYWSKVTIVCSDSLFVPRISTVTQSATWEGKGYLGSQFTVSHRGKPKQELKQIPWRSSAYRVVHPSAPGCHNPVAAPIPTSITNQDNAHRQSDGGSWGSAFPRWLLWQRWSYWDMLPWGDETLPSIAVLRKAWWETLL